VRKGGPRANAGRERNLLCTPHLIDPHCARKAASDPAQHVAGRYGKPTRRKSFAVIDAAKLAIEAKSGRVNSTCHGRPGIRPGTVSRLSKNGFETKGEFRANLADLAYSIIGPPEVIEVEIGQSRQLTPVTPKVDQAEVDRLIPADLSIPNFLRRLP
jgi:hypothetical protein